jgi:hypothetical protein
MVRSFIGPRRRRAQVACRRPTKGYIGLLIASTAFSSAVFATRDVGAATATPQTVSRICGSSDGACPYLTLATSDAGAWSDDTRGITQKEVLQWLTEHPDFLLSHPEVVERARALAIARAATAEAIRLRGIISAHKDLLSRVAAVTGMGAANGETLIVFMDYECLPCRADEPLIRSFSKTHPQWRVIELPMGVISEASREAANAVFQVQPGAARRLNIYFEHAPLPLSYAGVYAATERAAGSTASSKEKESDSTPDQIRTFAEALGVIGTPTYVAGCAVMPGRFDAARVLAARCPASH